MDTQRATTALEGSAAKSHVCQGLGPGLRHNPSGSGRLLQGSVRKPTSQKKVKTFQEVLAEVQTSNICRLKNRAFVANEVAKAATGKSREICYRLKSKTINELLKMGAASLCAIELSIEEPLIGITFIGGGKLHTLPSQLDAQARAILEEQLVFAINNGKSKRLSGDKLTTAFTSTAAQNRPGSRLKTKIDLSEFDIYIATRSGDFRRRHCRVLQKVNGVKPSRMEN